MYVTSLLLALYISVIALTDCTAHHTLAEVQQFILSVRQHFLP